MDYIFVSEAAEKWGVGVRQVQRLLQANRIPGAVKRETVWLIPADAEKPTDPRRAKEKGEITQPRYSYICMFPMPKGNPEAALLTIPEEYKSLFRADLAYRRGDPKPAMDAWHNTKDDSPAKLTSAVLGITAAISAGNYTLYDEIQRFLKSRMAQTNNERDKAMLSLPGTIAALCMVAPNMTPDWVQTADFSLFPQELAPFLLYLHAMYLRNIGDKRGVLATAKAEYILCAEETSFTWLDLNNLLLCAAASYDLGDRENAKKYLLSAMNFGLPCGMVMPFADTLSVFGGLFEECIEQVYPAQKAAISDLWSYFFKNWLSFHNHFTSDNISTILTAQEYQLARLLTHGATYSEAATQMNLSVGRIKNIQLGIYGKLYISKKSQLSSFIV